MRRINEYMNNNKPKGYTYFGHTEPRCCKLAYE